MVSSNDFRVKFDLKNNHLQNKAIKIVLFQCFNESNIEKFRSIKFVITSLIKELEKKKRINGKGVSIGFQ